MKQGSENNNWRGGRSVASNGYILLRVGVGHHLADVRGYAYEHRVVAEQKIGRRLLPGEHVHHIDENKRNNAPENLEVVANMKAHKFIHRSAKSRLRLPDEDNPLIDCACGCGESFLKYDETGRPRSFSHGHNIWVAPTRDSVFAVVKELGVAKTCQILEKSTGTKGSIKSTITDLVKYGKLKRIAHGLYTITEQN